MCLQINKPFSPRLMVLLFSSAILASDMYTFFWTNLVASNTLFGPNHEPRHEQTQGLTFHGHTYQNIRKHFRWGLKREQIAQIS